MWGEQSQINTAYTIGNQRSYTYIYTYNNILYMNPELCIDRLRTEQPIAIVKKSDQARRRCSSSSLCTFGEVSVFSTLACAFSYPSLFHRISCPPPATRRQNLHAACVHTCQQECTSVSAYVNGSHKHICDIAIPSVSHAFTKFS